MLELIGLGAAATAGIWGYWKSRRFVGKRLRFTKFVERPGIGIASGVVATIVASPVAWLPVIGIGTAIAFGAGVGTGVALGAKDAKRPLLED
jgi:hypothetical protein